MTNPALEPFDLQGYTFPPLGERAYMPVKPVDAYGMGSDERFEVVGESRYIDGIRRVLAARDADPDGDTHLYALLIQEPLNPYDRNAVRVDIFWNDVIATCGYLPREQAREFAPAIRRLADEGRIAAMLAQTYGGTPEKPNVGVWLGGR